MSTLDTWMLRRGAPAAPYCLVKNTTFSDLRLCLLALSRSFTHKWDDGREWKTEHLSDNSEPGTVKRKLEMDWVTRNPVGYNPQGWQTTPANEPRVKEVRTTLVDANLVSKSTHVNPSTSVVEIDEYNNVLKTWEYDFGVGSHGALLRRTETAYLATDPFQGSDNYATNTSIHIRDLPTSIKIYDSSAEL